MKNLQFNPYQCGAGWGGSKKSKLIPAPPRPAPPRGAGLKSPPIPAPLPLRGEENPLRRSGERRVKQGEAKLPSLFGTRSLG